MLNLAKIIPGPIATRNTMFKVIKSNTNIAKTPPRIARSRSEFHHVIGDALQMFKVKGQKSRSQDQMSSWQRKCIIQQQKRYNTAIDRFSDFKLAMVS